MLRPASIASKCWKRSALGISVRATSRVLSQKTYATVSSSIVGQAPYPAEPTREEISDSVSPVLDSLILQAASNVHKSLLPDIIKQYIDTAGTVLDLSLPYESRPSESRRPSLTNATDSCKDVVMVAHCAQVGSEHKLTLSSGFALNVKDKSNSKSETLILTCAHTLEEASPFVTVPRILVIMALSRYDNRLCFCPIYSWTRRRDVQGLSYWLVRELECRSSPFLEWSPHFLVLI